MVLYNEPNIYKNYKEACIYTEESHATVFLWSVSNTSWYYLLE